MESLTNFNKANIDIRRMTRVFINVIALFCFLIVELNAFTAMLWFDMYCLELTAKSAAELGNRVGVFLKIIMMLAPLIYQRPTECVLRYTSLKCLDSIGFDCHLHS